LQDKCYERVGDTRTQASNLRILAASNHDLPAAIAAGAFREDLYYRLNVIEVFLPSLRQRPRDIMPLGDHLLKFFARETGKTAAGFTKEASGGGKQRQLTFAKEPSYWHGWSPDGKTLAFCAERNKEFDVYTITVDGKEEKRLTSAKGLDDGPDYAPDGKHIYFNSERTGDMKIWRMNADGTEQQQVTKDAAYADWFPHPSPDGKWLVFLSYDKGVSGHPANQDVVLRIMPLAGGKARVLATLFGGQGTMNVPSWSPDSQQVAFVSYLLVLPE
jgi:Tol biopolymer transport system component